MARVIEKLKGLVRRTSQPGPGLKLIKSWMNIFQAKVEVVSIAGLEDLANVVRQGPYFCIGACHSYNGIQIVRRGGAKAIDMKKSGLRDLQYDDDAYEVTVGPAITILELKKAIIGEGRRLVSSGNFMEQTVIGALATGTHGYGAQAVMAESITALEFLDGEGVPVRLTPKDPHFKYAALAFGTIAPIISVTLKTAPAECFEVKTVFCRLSQKHMHVGPGDAVMYAAFPYSDRGDPTIALQVVRAAPLRPLASRRGSPAFTLGGISEFIIRRYWAFDGAFPVLRRPFQRLIAKLNLQYERVYYTEPNDLDYLYDPEPGLESSRRPNILKNLLSPTHTAYNLAFFVPLERATEVVRFIMQQAEEFREHCFFLRSMIGVRELSSTSELPFAPNFERPVAAIDIFADVRYYAWLERMQREVAAYFDGVRPHWGKSAVVEEFAETLGRVHLNAHREFHDAHYRPGQLRTTDHIRRLFGIVVTPPQ